MKRSQRWRSLVYYGAQAATAAVILLFLFRTVLGRLDVPLFYYGDAIHHLIVAKALIDQGWWWHISRLSTPYTLPMIMFPVGGTVDYAVMDVLARFSHSPGLVLNVFWLLSMVLASISCTWSLRRLRVPAPIAFVLGILYGLLPHAFYRNISHLMLVTYLVPPVCAWSVLLASRRGTGLSRRERRLFWVACGLIGFNYIYTAFFACIAMGIAAALSKLSGSRENARLALVSIGVICAAVVVNLLPTEIAWHADPKAKKMLTSFKVPNEADLYGLKVRQLITPIPEHWFKPLRRAQHLIDGAGFPVETENTFSRMGLCASIGLLWLLWIAFTRAHRARPVVPDAEDDATLSALATLCLGFVLIGMLGGFGSLFNVFILPDIRCYNRCSILVAFYSMAAFGLLLKKVELLRAPGSPKRSAASVAVLSLLLVYGVSDQQLSGMMVGRHPDDVALFDQQARFVRRIEGLLPAGSAIYQLPFTDYPVTPTVERMNPNDPAGAYTTSTRDLRWSWPSLSSEAIDWNRKLTPANPAKFIADLRARSFQGIWLDRFGYKSRTESPEPGLIAALGAPIESDGGRYAFFRLPAR